MADWENGPVGNFSVPAKMTLLMDVPRVVMHCVVGECITVTTVH